MALLYSEPDSIDPLLRMYLPQDRWQALVHGHTLPEQAYGTALFADISGFTTLTETLARMLGPRHGADELASLLDQVYDALIVEVERFNGSVIGFTGDAITCWFTGDEPSDAAPTAARRTLGCSLAIQQAMAQFTALALPDGSTTSLAIKVALASGTTKRLVVGDPATQLIDTLAGAPIMRLAAGEQLAAKSEVLLDTATAAALARWASFSAWRSDPDTGEQFAVVDQAAVDHDGLVAELPSGNHAARATPAAPLLRPWLLPLLYERLNDGLGEFLTELRPAVALLLRFTGIEYEVDAAAGSKLDALVRRVQQVLARYGGTLIQLAIGDKGSYLYAAFGAPIAHEDDDRRALLAAIELRGLPAALDFVQAVQLGIERGIMRSGAYGGRTRRTYGALGDATNVAARLMNLAAANEILVSEHVRQRVDGAFTWQTRPAVALKGKHHPLAVARLIDARGQPMDGRRHAGVIIGRESELGQLHTLVQPLIAGRFGGVVTIGGEPGIGKSRLLHAFRQQLDAGVEHPVRWLLCRAEGLLRQSLHPFVYALRDYFDQQPGSPDTENTIRFDAILDQLRAALNASGDAELSSELQRTRSFLGAIIDLGWPGSLYEQLDPKLRFENTIAALRTLLLAESRRQPVIIQIEDAHWLDDDSLAFVQALTRGVESYPLVVLISSRVDEGGALSMALDEGVPRTLLDLKALTPDGAAALAVQLLGGTIAGDSIAWLHHKTRGNPLFVEQLVLDLRERGRFARDEHGAWCVPSQTQIDVPDGVTAVLIARLDRLTAQVRAVVQTAAVLGQEFEVPVLSVMLRDDAQLPAKLEHAEAESIWQSLTELRY